MIEIFGTYLGEKRNKLTHGPSKAVILTDAPLDNNGKGESFSPTDMLAGSLASCAMTIMSIWAEKNQVSLERSTFVVKKNMASEPRRVASLDVEYKLPKQLSDEVRAKLESLAMTCPVKLSLHPEVAINFEFKYEV